MLNSGQDWPRHLESDIYKGLMEETQETQETQETLDESAQV